MTTPCVFCSVAPESRIDANDLAVAVADAFPVTPGHALVVPRRHVPDFFELSEEEHVAILDLLRILRRTLLHDDPSIGGFNVGINVGTTAGQTIPHCHVHLIPRRSGDVPNPRGGIRHVIPGKGDYPAGTGA